MCSPTMPATAIMVEPVQPGGYIGLCRLAGKNGRGRLLLCQSVVMMPSDVSAATRYASVTAAGFAPGRGVGS